MKLKIYYQGNIMSKIIFPYLRCNESVRSEISNNLTANSTTVHSDVISLAFNKHCGH